MIISLLLCIFPTPFVRYLANVVGHRIEKGARIGFSFVDCKKLYMARGSRIGHFNLIKCRKLLLRERAYIGHLNSIRGPFSLLFNTQGAIGNRNVIVRAQKGISVGPASLKVGILSKLTASHKIDLTNSISFGNYSTLAGTGSSIWTHGYVHDEEGAGRYRVDGAVRVGHNVYIGASCNILGGVTIADKVIVGVGSTIPKSLKEPGMYVSAPLRKLIRPQDPAERTDMEKVESEELIETVYRKVNVDT